MAAHMEINPGRRLQIRQHHGVPGIDPPPGEAPRSLAGQGTERKSSASETRHGNHAKAIRPSIPAWDLRKLVGARDPHEQGMGEAWLPGMQRTGRGGGYRPSEE